ncbi:MAG: hypothetical protein D6830_00845 [Ignavibacteria bacterium]|nr:MAG: hypothetical protein D6830_00845 [Ignavibacteria bacterium]
MHKYISDDIFNSLGNMELKLGYSSFDILSDGYVDEFNDNYFFISNFSKELAFKKSGGILKPELWQFGFAKRDGYGYKTEYFSVHPYHAGGIAWSRLKVTAPDIRTFAPVPQNALVRFNEEFRFGTINEGGINLGFGDGFISLNAGYKLDVIFPRYLIWKHLGSFIIEQAAQKGLDTFIDAIMDHSSASGPIVNVLLKNGLSYAFYTLKRENMNWPFNTEAPLTFETFKFGITFTF